MSALNRGRGVTHQYQTDGFYFIARLPRIQGEGFSPKIAPERVLAAYFERTTNVLDRARSRLRAPDDPSINFASPSVHALPRGCTWRARTLKLSLSAHASLGDRLSSWLVLQSLAALVAVSLLVYLAVAWSLSDRRMEELHLKHAAIEEAIRPEAAVRTADLRRRLDDFMAGHQDMMLRIVDSSAEVVYLGGTRKLGDSPVVAFDVNWPPDPTGRAIAYLSVDVSADADVLKRLGVSLALASVLGAIVVAWTGRRLVSRGLAPVRELAIQAELLCLDRPGIRLNGASQPLELRPLVDRFNDLLTRVESAYVQMESFNCDVAHELRTPLTTLIGSSELALTRERTADELREVIASNLEELNSLAALVGDMLFLSQADRGARARRAHVDSLASVAKEIVCYHEAAFQETDVEVVVVDDVAASVDVRLIRRVMSNLLDNAARYASAGSTISILMSSVNESRLRLAVRNTGPQIPAEVLPRLFDRFYRAEASRPGPHYGLGLAIVAAIARMHGGHTFAESDERATTVGIEIDAA